MLKTIVTKIVQSLVVDVAKDAAKGTYVLTKSIYNHFKRENQKK